METPKDFCATAYAHFSHDTMTLADERLPIFHAGRHIVILTYSRLLFFPSFGRASISHKFSYLLDLQRLLMSCSLLLAVLLAPAAWLVPSKEAGHICGHMNHHHQHHRQDE